jgi:hypothetical protein
MLTNQFAIENQLLIIRGSFETPKLVFDGTRGSYALTGSSQSIDPKLFWDPLLKWAEEFIKEERKESLFEFEFEYINSGSLSFILNFIRTLKKSRGEIKFNWHVQENDESIIDIVEILNELLDDKISMIII